MIFLGRRSIRLSLPLLIGAMLVFANRAPASTDYSAGKTPEQLFDSDCSGCHHLPYRLAHGRNERSLTNFLREHYTTNARSAGCSRAISFAPVPATLR
jgi:organic hydroperoxide reductase OsmC/OhrA